MIRSGTVIIAVSSLFFAVGAVLTGQVANQIPAAQLVLIRHLVGLLAMVVFFASRRGRPNFHRPWLLLLRGLLGGGAALAYFYAIQLLGIASATVLNYIAPAYATVWAALFLRERIHRAGVLGISLATIGAILVTVGSVSISQGNESIVGAICAIAAGVLGGGGMATVKAVREDTDAPSVFTAFSIVGFLLCAPFAVEAWQPLHGVALPALAIAIGLLSLVGQLLFTAGMRYTTATAGSATTQLVPVFAWLISLGFLRERVTTLSAVGAGLCVSGVLAGTLRKVPWRR